GPRGMITASHEAQNSAYRPARSPRRYAAARDLRLRRTGERLACALDRSPDPGLRLRSHGRRPPLALARRLLPPRRYRPAFPGSGAFSRRVAWEGGIARHTSMAYDARCADRRDTRFHRANRRSAEQ